MSASGIATRETTRSRQMGTNKPVTTQSVGSIQRSGIRFHDIWVYPAQHITWVVQTRYNARRVLYQKDVFSILDQSYPFHEMGVYLESLGTELPKPQSDNSLPGGWGLCVIILYPPQQQMCVHSAQLTLQGQHARP